MAVAGSGAVGVGGVAAVSGSPSAELETQVVQRDGQVVILFSRRSEGGDLVGAQTDNLYLTPVAAQQMAELLTAMAFEADTGLKPVSDTLKASIVEGHRDRLLPRLTIMLASMLNEKRSEGTIALQLMDTVLSEILS